MSALSEFYASTKAGPVYTSESLKMDIIEQIAEGMASACVNRKQLAKRMGVSPAAVTGFLSDGRNFTIDTIAKIAHAIDCTVTVTISHRCAHNVIMDSSHTSVASMKNRRFTGANTISSASHPSSEATCTASFWNNTTRQFITTLENSQDDTHAQSCISAPAA